MGSLHRSCVQHGLSTVLIRNLHKQCLFYSMSTKSLYLYKTCPSPPPPCRIKGAINNSWSPFLSNQTSVQVTYLGNKNFLFLPLTLIRYDFVLLALELAIWPGLIDPLPCTVVGIKKNSNVFFYRQKSFSARHIL